MRKQLKENQHKKKLQFKLMGKRNESEESFAPKKIEIQNWKRNNHKNNTIWKSNLSKIFENIKQVEENENLQNKNKDEHEKKSKLNDGKDLVSQPEQLKGIAKELGYSDDRDLTLLKILYDGLNSSEGKLPDVGPLVQTLKDIADKKIASNDFSQGIKTKTVGLNQETSNDLKHMSALKEKMSVFKSKHNDTTVSDNRIGSSPLNPNCINTKGNSILVSKCLSNDHPDPTRDKQNQHKFSFPANISSDQNVMDDKKSNDNSLFVTLIDKIISTINPNGSIESERIRNMYDTFQNTQNELHSEKLLEGLLKGLTNNNVGVNKALKGNRPEYKKKVRNIRDLKHKQDIFKVRSTGIPLVKMDESFKLETRRPNNKNWMKSDDLRRLQKVAYELKNKIDDLLMNIESNIVETDYDEEDDVDDDEYDEFDGSDSARTDTTNQINTNKKKLTGANRSKYEDPYDSFHRFKPSSNKKGKELRKSKTQRDINDTTSRKREQKDSIEVFNQEKQNREKRDAYDTYQKKERKISGDVKVKQEKKDEENIVSFIKDPNKLQTKSHSIKKLPSQKAAVADVNDDSSIPYKDTPSSFDVIKLANDFKKSHPNTLEERWEGNSQLENFHKYMSHQRNRSLLNIYNMNYNGSNFLDPFLQRSGGNDDEYPKSNNKMFTRQMKRDESIHHLDSDLLNRIDQFYRYKRSLLHLLQIFNPKKNKTTDGKNNRKVQSTKATSKGQNVTNIEGLKRKHEISTSNIMEATSKSANGDKTKHIEQADCPTRYVPNRHHNDLNSLQAVSKIKMKNIKNVNN